MLQIDSLHHDSTRGFRMLFRVDTCEDVIALGYIVKGLVALLPARIGKHWLRLLVKSTIFHPCSSSLTSLVKVKVRRRSAVAGCVKQSLKNSGTSEKRLSRLRKKLLKKYLAGFGKNS